MFIQISRADFKRVLKNYMSLEQIEFIKQLFDFIFTKIQQKEKSLIQQDYTVGGLGSTHWIVLTINGLLHSKWAWSIRNQLATVLDELICSMWTSFGCLENDGNSNFVSTSQFEMYQLHLELTFRKWLICSFVLDTLFVLMSWACCWSRTTVWAAGTVDMLQSEVAYLEITVQTWVQLQHFNKQTSLRSR